VLTEAGVSLSEAYSAIEAIKSVFDPRGLRPGQQLRLNLRQQDKASKSVHLERLALVSAVDQSISLRHLENELFDALVLPLEHERQIVSRSGRITTSFYDATVNKGVPMAVLLQVDDTLRSVIDFRRDIRRGDSFALEFELFDDGENGGIHPGKLVSVSLGLNNRTLVISRFTTADGYTGFFNLTGRSIETSLMTTPLEDSRLSSLFGNRNHPILGYKRFHKGIDFAAPRGTPVFAAGDGVVLQRRRFGGLGKFIKIQHDKVYTTTYAHLSKYAIDLEPGRRVRQGEIIGYVGDTGLASGPNLHYEVRANGRETNPLTLELPPRRVLSGEELARFQQQAASLAIVSGFRAPADARGHTGNVAARGDGNE
jgi:murein DD-endopeptidase MepM/ murein hydrolase activator NlpD